MSIICLSCLAVVVIILDLRATRLTAHVPMALHQAAWTEAILFRWDVSEMTQIIQAALRNMKPSDQEALSKVAGDVVHSAADYGLLSDVLPVVCEQLEGHMIRKPLFPIGNYWRYDWERLKQEGKAWLKEPSGRKYGGNPATANFHRMCRAYCDCRTIWTPPSPSEEGHVLLKRYIENYCAGANIMLKTENRYEDYLEFFLDKAPVSCIEALLRVAAPIALKGEKSSEKVSLTAFASIITRKNLSPATNTSTANDALHGHEEACQILQLVIDWISKAAPVYLTCFVEIFIRKAVSLSSLHIFFPVLNRLPCVADGSMAPVAIQRSMNWEDWDKLTASERELIILMKGVRSNVRSTAKLQDLSSDAHLDNKKVLVLLRRYANSAVSCQKSGIPFQRRFTMFSPINYVKEFFTLPLGVPSSAWTEAILFRWDVSEMTQIIQAALRNMKPSDQEALSKVAGDVVHSAADYGLLSDVLPVVCEQLEGHMIRKPLFPIGNYWRYDWERLKQEGKAWLKEPSGRKYGGNPATANFHRLCRAYCDCRTIWTPPSPSEEGHVLLKRYIENYCAGANIMFKTENRYEDYLEFFLDKAPVSCIEALLRVAAPIALKGEKSSEKVSLTAFASIITRKNLSPATNTSTANDALHGHEEACQILQLVVDRLTNFKLGDLVDCAGKNDKGLDFISMVAAEGLVHLFWPILLSLSYFNDKDCIQLRNEIQKEDFDNLKDDDKMLFRLKLNTLTNMYCLSYLTGSLVQILACDLGKGCSSPLVHAIIPVCSVLFCFARTRPFLPFPSIYKLRIILRVASSIFIIIIYRIIALNFYFRHKKGRKKNKSYAHTHMLQWFPSSPSYAPEQLKEEVEEVVSRCCSSSSTRHPQTSSSAPPMEPLTRTISSPRCENTLGIVPTPSDAEQFGIPLTHASVAVCRSVHAQAERAPAAAASTYSVEDLSNCRLPCGGLSDRSSRVVAAGRQDPGRTAEAQHFSGPPCPPYDAGDDCLHPSNNEIKSFASMERSDALLVLARRYQELEGRHLQLTQHLDEVLHQHQVSAQRMNLDAASARASYLQLQERHAALWSALQDARDEREKLCRLQRVHDVERAVAQQTHQRAAALWEEERQGWQRQLEATSAEQVQCESALLSWMAKYEALEDVVRTLQIQMDAREQHRLRLTSGSGSTMGEAGEKGKGDNRFHQSQSPSLSAATSSGSGSAEEEATSFKGGNILSRGGGFAHGVREELQARVELTSRCSLPSPHHHHPPSQSRRAVDTEEHSVLQVEDGEDVVPVSRIPMADAVLSNQTSTSEEEEEEEERGDQVQQLSLCTEREQSVQDVKGRQRDTMRAVVHHTRVCPRQELQAPEEEEEEEEEEGNVSRKMFRGRRDDRAPLASTRSASSGSSSLLHNLSGRSGGYEVSVTHAAPHAILMPSPVEAERVLYPHTHAGGTNPGEVPPRSPPLAATPLGGVEANGKDGNHRVGQPSDVAATDDRRGERPPQHRGAEEEQEDKMSCDDTPHRQNIRIDGSTGSASLSRLCGSGPTGSSTHPLQGVDPAKSQGAVAWEAADLPLPLPARHEVEEKLQQALGTVSAAEVELAALRREQREAAAQRDAARRHHTRCRDELAALLLWTSEKSAEMRRRWYSKDACEARRRRGSNVCLVPVDGPSTQRDKEDDEKDITPNPERGAAWDQNKGTVGSERVGVDSRAGGLGGRDRMPPARRDTPMDTYGGCSPPPSAPCGTGGKSSTPPYAFEAPRDASTSWGHTQRSSTAPTTATGRKEGYGGRQCTTQCSSYSGGITTRSGRSSGGSGVVPSRNNRSGKRNAPLGLSGGRRAGGVEDSSTFVHPKPSATLPMDADDTADLIAGLGERIETLFGDHLCLIRSVREEKERHRRTWREREAARAEVTDLTAELATCRQRHAAEKARWVAQHRAHRELVGKRVEDKEELDAKEALLRRLQRRYEEAVAECHDLRSHKEKEIKKLKQALQEAETVAQCLEEARIRDAETLGRLKDELLRADAASPPPPLAAAEVLYAALTDMTALTVHLLLCHGALCVKDFYRQRAEAQWTSGAGWADSSQGHDKHQEKKQARSEQMTDEEMRAILWCLERCGPAGVSISSSPPDVADRATGSRSYGHHTEEETKKGQCWITAAAAAGPHWHPLVEVKVSVLSLWCIWYERCVDCSGSLAGGSATRCGAALSSLPHEHMMTWRQLCLPDPVWQRWVGDDGVGQTEGLHGMRGIDVMPQVVLPPMTALVERLRPKFASAEEKERTEGTRAAVGHAAPLAAQVLRIAQLPLSPALPFSLQDMTPVGGATSHNAYVLSRYLVEDWMSRRPKLKEQGGLKQRFRERLRREAMTSSSTPGGAAWVLIMDDVDEDTKEGASLTSKAIKKKQNQTDGQPVLTPSTTPIRNGNGTAGRPSAIASDLILPAEDQQRRVHLLSHLLPGTFGETALSTFAAQFPAVTERLCALRDVAEAPSAPLPWKPPPQQQQQQQQSMRLQLLPALCRWWRSQEGAVQQQESMWAALAARCEGLQAALEASRRQEGRRVAEAQQAAVEQCRAEASQEMAAAQAVWVEQIRLMEQAVEGEREGRRAAQDLLADYRRRELELLAERWELQNQLQAHSVDTRRALLRHDLHLPTPTNSDESTLSPSPFSAKPPLVGSTSVAAARTTSAGMSWLYRDQENASASGEQVHVGAPGGHGSAAAGVWPGGDAIEGQCGVEDRRTESSTRTRWQRSVRSGSACSVSSTSPPAHGEGEESTAETMAIEQAKQVATSLHQLFVAPQSFSTAVVVLTFLGAEQQPRRWREAGRGARTGQRQRSCASPWLQRKRLVANALLDGGARNGRNIEASVGVGTNVFFNIYIFILMGIQAPVSPFLWMSTMGICLLMCGPYMHLMLEKLLFFFNSFPFFSFLFVVQQHSVFSVYSLSIRSRSHMASPPAPNCVEEFDRPAHRCGDPAEMGLEEIVSLLLDLKKEGRELRRELESVKNELKERWPEQGWWRSRGEMPASQQCTPDALSQQLVTLVLSSASPDPVEMEALLERGADPHTIIHDKGRSRTVLHELTLPEATAVLMLVHMVARLQDPTKETRVSWEHKEATQGHNFLNAAAASGRLSAMWLEVQIIPALGDKPNYYFELTVPVETKDWSRLPPRHKRMFRRITEIDESLEATKALIREVHQFRQRGDTRRIDTLVEDGADVMAWNKELMPILTYAILNCPAKVVEGLLTSPLGIDFTRRDGKFHYSPLHVICKARFTDEEVRAMLNAVLDRPPYVDDMIDWGVLDNGRYSPISRAAYYGRLPLFVQVMFYERKVDYFIHFPGPIPLRLSQQSLDCIPLSDTDKGRFYCILTQRESQRRSLIYCDEWNPWTRRWCGTKERNSTLRRTPSWCKTSFTDVFLFVCLFVYFKGFPVLLHSQHGEENVHPAPAGGGVVLLLELSRIKQTLVLAKHLFEALLSGLYVILYDLKMVQWRNFQSYRWLPCLPPKSFAKDLYYWAITNSKGKEESPNKLPTYHLFIPTRIPFYSIPFSSLSLSHSLLSFFLQHPSRALCCLVSVGTPCRRDGAYKTTTCNRKAFLYRWAPPTAWKVQLDAPLSVTPSHCSPQPTQTQAPLRPLDPSVPHWPHATAAASTTHKPTSFPSPDGTTGEVRLRCRCCGQAFALERREKAACQRAGAASSQEGEGEGMHGFGRTPAVRPAAQDDAVALRAGCRHAALHHWRQYVQRRAGDSCRSSRSPPSRRPPPLAHPAIGASIESADGRHYGPLRPSLFSPWMALPEEITTTPMGIASPADPIRHTRNRRARWAGYPQGHPPGGGATDARDNNIEMEPKSARNGAMGRAAEPARSSRGRDGKEHEEASGRGCGPMEVGSMPSLLFTRAQRRQGRYGGTTASPPVAPHFPSVGWMHVSATGREPIRLPCRGPSLLVSLQRHPLTSTWPQVLQAWEATLLRFPSPLFSSTSALLCLSTVEDEDEDEDKIEVAFGKAEVKLWQHMQQLLPLPSCRRSATSDGRSPGAGSDAVAGGGAAQGTHITSSSSSAPSFCSLYRGLYTLLIRTEAQEQQEAQERGDAGTAPFVPEAAGLAHEQEHGIAAAATTTAAAPVCCSCWTSLVLPHLKRQEEAAAAAWAAVTTAVGRPRSLTGYRRLPRVGQPVYVVGAGGRPARWSLLTDAATADEIRCMLSGIPLQHGVSSSSSSLYAGTSSVDPVSDDDPTTAVGSEPYVEEEEEEAALLEQVLQAEAEERRLAVECAERRAVLAQRCAALRSMKDNHERRIEAEMQKVPVCRRRCPALADERHFRTPAARERTHASALSLSPTPTTTPTNATAIELHGSVECDTAETAAALVLSRLEALAAQDLLGFAFPGLAPIPRRPQGITHGGRLPPPRVRWWRRLRRVPSRTPSPSAPAVPPRSTAEKDRRSTRGRRRRRRPCWCRSYTILWRRALLRSPGRPLGGSAPPPRLYYEDEEEVGHLLGLRLGTSYRIRAGLHLLTDREVEGGAGRGRSPSAGSWESSEEEEEEDREAEDGPSPFGGAAGGPLLSHGTPFWPMLAIQLQQHRYARSALLKDAGALWGKGGRAPRPHAAPPIRSIAASTNSAGASAALSSPTSSLWFLVPLREVNTALGTLMTAVAWLYTLHQPPHPVWQQPPSLLAMGNHVATTTPVYRVQLCPATERSTLRLHRLPASPPPTSGGDGAPKALVNRGSAGRKGAARTEASCHGTPPDNARPAAAAPAGGSWWSWLPVHWSNSRSMLRLPATAVPVALPPSHSSGEEAADEGRQLCFYVEVSMKTWFVEDFSEACVIFAAAVVQPLAQELQQRAARRAAELGAALALERHDGAGPMREAGDGSPAAEKHEEHLTNDSGSTTTSPAGIPHAARRRQSEYHVKRFAASAQREMDRLLLVASGPPYVIDSDGSIGSAVGGSRPCVHRASVRESVWTVGMRRLLAVVQWCVAASSVLLPYEQHVADGEEGNGLSTNTKIVKLKQREGNATALTVLASKGGNNFAYATPQSVVMRTEKKAPAEKPNAPPTYPITGLYGAAAGDVIAFDYNESFIAAIAVKRDQQTKLGTSAAERQLLIWNATDGELIEKKVQINALQARFQSEGQPISVCVAGKHHVLIGTASGRVISVNTSSENNEPKAVQLPQPAGTPAGQPNQSRVVAVTASKIRPELVACGTTDGTLGLFVLSASTGLRLTASVQPFPTPSLITGAPALPVSTLAFSPFTDNYLAMGSSEGAVSIFSVDANALMMSFTYIAKDVSGLAWASWEQGSLYVSSKHHGYVMKYSTNSKTEVERICPGTSLPRPSPTGTDATLVPVGKLKQLSLAASAESSSLSGITGIGCVEGQGLALALCDGGVHVYYLPRQQTALKAPPQHTHPALCAAVSKQDSQMYATAGADGRILVWMTSLPLQPQHLLRVGGVHSGLAVTALQWSSNGKHIYAGLHNGEVFGFTLTTQTVIWRTAVFAGTPVTCFAYTNAGTAPVLLAGGKEGVAVVTKDGTVSRRIRTPAAVQAMDLEPSRGKALLVGGADHNVYVYQLQTDASSTTADAPLLTLTGHTAPITGMAFNTVNPTFFVSTSEDGTCRVWDLSGNEGQNISTQARVITTPSPVRSVAWCASLAPFLFLTGGEDAAVRLWDCRTPNGGLLVAHQRSAHAPVVSLLTHPERPLLVTSLARDGTLTTWTLGAVRQAALDAALGMLDQRLTAVPDPTLLMRENAQVSVSAPAAGPLATSPAVQAMVTELRNASKPIERLEKITGFFDTGVLGINDLRRQAAMAVNPAAISLNLAEALRQSIMFPGAQAVDAYRAQAHHLLEKARGKTVTNAGAEFKKARLLEAAERLFKVGLLEEAINVYGEAGQWETALALAPVISRDFWSQMCVKAATAMEVEGRVDRAAAYLIASGDSQRAAQLYARAAAPQLDEALVLAKTCPQKTGAPSGAAPEATIDSNGTSSVAQALAEERLYALQQLQAPAIQASLLLMEGKNDEAVRLLAEAGEVALAHLLVHTVPLQQQESIDLAYRMDLRQCCCGQQWDAAIFCANTMTLHHDGFATIIAAFQESIPMQEAATSSEKLRAFYDRIKQECTRTNVSLDHNVIQQQHAADGMASQNQLAAMIISSDPATGPYTSIPLIQSFTGFLESLLGVALQDVDGPNAAFYLKQAYSICGYVSLPKMPAGSPMAAEYRTFLALSFLLSTLMCVKLYRLPRVLNHAFTKANELGQGLANVEALIGRVHGCLSSYAPGSTDVNCIPSGSGILVFDTTKKGARLVSAITNEPITGPAVALKGPAEPGNAYVSREEALHWALISHFSPLADGSRFYAV
eukprot:gene11368-7874_t